MNSTMTETKNTLERTNSRNKAVEWISELEDRMVEITEAKQNKETRMKRNEDSLRVLWDHIKHTNIQITGVTEEKKRKIMRKYLRRLVEKFPNMRKKIATQVQEAQRVPYRISQRETHQDTFNQTNKN